MSTEGNINRVSSPGLDRERAALESAGSGIAANRIHHVDSVKVSTSEMINAAALNEMEISQQHEGVIQSSPEQTQVAPPFVIPDPPPPGWEFEKVQTIDEEPISVAEVTKLLTEHFAKNTLTRDPDLSAFKKQVISAFKHLGLDTRKHFGV